jgi:RNA polymerase subunit RPABC4/transcription elongation factor Spt4
MAPPEAESIKSMLRIAGIISLIFGILFLLGGILYLVWVSILIGAAFGLMITIWFIILGIVDIMIYSNCKNISNMVDQRQYEEAKSKALVWMILGFIFGGLIPGILILLAFLKFDNLINATRGMGYAPPPPQYAAPPPQPQTRTCMGCGRQIPLSFNNCPHCGKAVESTPQQQTGGMRTCMGCGQQISASYKVCPHCGRQAGQ